MDSIKRLIKYIKDSKNIVFFGGAGVSTESGVPDFRSEDGLYNQKNSFSEHPVEYFLSRECLVKEPELFYKFYREKMDTRNVEPNITHMVLAELEKRGKLSAIVTQNIDSLHQMAGSRVVFELHGSAKECVCMNCGKSFDENYIFDSKEVIPCCSCGGIVRPAIVLYEEILSNDAIKGAVDAIRRADMLLVCGTSLSVYPAAHLVHEFAGDHLVVINNEKLNLYLEDNDLFIEASLGEVFNKIQILLSKGETYVV